MPAKTIYCNQRSQPIEYSIMRGFDPGLTLQADQDWLQEKAIIFREISVAQPLVVADMNLFQQILADYNMSDWHWSWSNKAFHCTTTGYEWFYLVADNKVQAICIIYYPKASPLCNDNVFYVDYLAVAHWNRSRPNHTRQFVSLGTVLLSHCIQYSVEQLKYRAGFFLHSLPSAEAYYAKKGLSDLGVDPNYYNLRMFEASEDCSKAILKEYADA